MTPRTADRPTLPAPVRRLGNRWWWPLVAVAIAVGLFGASRLVASSPPTVERVTFVNASDYDLGVEVSSAARDGWLSLTTAKARASTDVADVVDVGSTWIFRFAGQGRDGGEVEVSRADLARDGWRLEIPESVARRVAPPSP